MNRISAQSFLGRKSRICKNTGALVFTALLMFLQGAVGANSMIGRNSLAISKAASAKCATKLKEVEEFKNNTGSPKKKTTQFSEDEINSYIMLELRQNFSRSLKELQMQFNVDSIQIAADIDFDAFGDKSVGLPEKLLAAAMSGIHTLTAAGQLHANDGEVYFELSEVQIDEHIVPKFLAEEIISGVARRQKPPFDPLQPSQMPYHIKSVEVRKGMIIIYQ
jgi:hypothetical protein